MKLFQFKRCDDRTWSSIDLYCWWMWPPRFSTNSFHNLRFEPLKNTYLYHIYCIYFFWRNSHLHTCKYQLWFCKSLVLVIRKFLCLTNSRAGKKTLKKSCSKWDGFLIFFLYFWSKITGTIFFHSKSVLCVWCQWLAWFSWPPSDGAFATEHR
jgi:hypothetical protein